MVRVLEDLLDYRRAGIRQYRRLHKELKEVLSLEDAKTLAWHITIPQDTEGTELRTREKIKQIVGQYDTLTCGHCHTELNIPIDSYRFHDKTYKMYQYVLYEPSRPQECECGNLKTLTDIRGNLRAYLEDTDLNSLQLFHGPLNLMEAKGYTTPHPIGTLLDAERPQASDLFLMENRAHLRVNHVNLYKVSKHVQNILLPYEDLIGYARSFNIVIYLEDSVVFPTGHLFKYHQLSLENTFKFPELRKKVLNVTRAERLNALTTHLYHDILPKTIEKVHDSRTKTFENRLNIQRSYAPMAPYIPYMLRLSRAETIDTVMERVKPPLALYSELGILRLTRFTKKARFKKFNKQDFRLRKVNINNVDNRHSLSLYLTASQLRLMKRERTDALRFILPRFQQPPSVSLRYTTNHFTYLQLPSFIPPNHTLIP